MAGGQRHQLDFTRIPGRHEMAAALRVFLDLLDHPVDLVDGSAIGGAPVAPLRAINPAQIPLGIGPFIPDRHSMLLEILDVGIALQEPEQLIYDGFEVQLLGRQQREAFAQREARLRPEDRVSSRAGPVGLELPLLKHLAQKLVILNHTARKIVAPLAPEGE